MIDNLKDAITHAREVAKNWESQLVNCVSEEGRNACLDRAAEHELIASWLEELAERREADKWNVIRTEADLPKKDGEYMVIVSSCYGYTFEIGDIDIYKFEAGRFQTDTPVGITYWRPLPKLPESENNK